MSAISKQNCVLCHIMRKSHTFKIRCYAEHMVELNEYLDIFTGSDIDNKICEGEPNEILMNNTPNGWDNQDFMQGFDSETATYNKSINVFECMDISDYICEGIGKPFTEKLNRLDTNNYCSRRTTRVRYALYKSNP